MPLDGRTPTVEEQRWMDDVCEIGCVVCLVFLQVYSPAGPHHMDGKTKPGVHLKTLGLCGNHHQIPDSTGQDRWTARHENKARFEKRYATEDELLDMSKQLVAKKREAET